MHMGRDPMGKIIQELIGYNAAYYHLQDYPDRVAHLLGVLEASLRDPTGCPGLSGLG